MVQPHSLLVIAIAEEDKLCMFNSFAGKANHYGTHVAQEKKVLRVAGKRSLQTTYTI